MFVDEMTERSYAEVHMNRCDDKGRHVSSGNHFVQLLESIVTVHRDSLTLTVEMKIPKLLSKGFDVMQTQA